MASFLIAYAPVAKFEGGYANIRDDNGGETYAGIARKFWADWSGWDVIDKAKTHPSFAKGSINFSKYLSSINGLSECVSNWYKIEWWDKLGLEQLPQKIANEIFEQTVNLGKGGAGKLIQRACNAFNFCKKSNDLLFSDLVEDGLVGPKTINALSILIKERVNEKSLVHVLNCLQGAFYISIASKNITQRKFLDGWITRTYNPS